MSQRNNAWPACPDKEHLFTKAMLIHGPLPKTGFSLTRNPAGRVIYVSHRGRDAKKFVNNVTDMFYEDVHRRYSVRGWSNNHYFNVARSWKNEFLRWIWDEIDRNRTAD